MVLNTHYTVANVPPGLSVVVTGTSATTATVTLAGNAGTHESASDIGSLSVNFLSAAFTARPALKVLGSSKADFIVDFSNAPTPTPTATPTGIPTMVPVVPTNTPVPTSTPVPTNTPTPIPSSTPTPVPSSTPTPTGTDLTGVLLDRQGAPVGGVLVTAKNPDGSVFGVVRTEQDGTYRIPNADPTKRYTLAVQNGNFTIPSGTEVIGTGQFGVIRGTTRDLNPKNCEERDVSILLVELAKKVTVVRDLSLTAAERLPRAASRRATENFNGVLATILTQLREFPTPELNCAANISGCTEMNLTATQRAASRSLTTQRRQALAINQKLRNMDRRSPRASSQFRRAIRDAAQAATAFLEALSKTSDQCS